jgi:hypothetical protein
MRCSHYQPVTLFRILQLAQKAKLCDICEVRGVDDLSSGSSGSRLASCLRWHGFGIQHPPNTHGGQGATRPQHSVYSILDHHRVLVRLHDRRRMQVDIVRCNHPAVDARLHKARLLRQHRCSYLSYGKTMLHTRRLNLNLDAVRAVGGSHQGG